MREKANFLDQDYQELEHYEKLNYNNKLDQINEFVSYLIDETDKP